MYCNFLYKKVNKSYIVNIYHTDGAIKGRILSLVIRFFLILTLVPIAIDPANAELKESGRVVSIDANQLPIKDALNEASHQSGWTIVVDERLVGDHVSGSFKDVELESFLRRTLKGGALIVLYDEEAKSIDIRSFGATSKMITFSPNPDPATPEEKKRIQALRVEEQTAYDSYISNPDSIEPMTGMTLGEIAALHEAEQKAYDKYISNPDSIEPMTGLKLADIKTLSENEQTAYGKYISNPDSIEPMTGLKLNEISTLHEREQIAYDKHISQPKSISPSGENVAE